MIDSDSQALMIHLAAGLWMIMAGLVCPAELFTDLDPGVGLVVSLAGARITRLAGDVTWH